MKKMFLAAALSAAFVSTSQDSNAAIRRVGFFMPPVAGVDYNDLGSVQTASAVGDTVLIFPGSSLSGTVTKKLVFIGKGYLTSGAGSNANLQNLTGNSTVNLQLTAAASGTIIEGMDNGGVQAAANNVNSVVIRRCRSLSVTFGYGGSFTASDWVIQQCFELSLGISSLPQVNNILVANNHIQSTSFGSLTSASNGLFQNNVFSTSSQDVGLGNFSVNNNIFLSGSAVMGGNNVVFLNNLSPSVALPAGNGNVNSVSLTNVFVGYPTQGANSADGRFQLKPASPAIGAGLSGVDCGMFGGPNPYRLSGIPDVPAFYQLSAPTTVTTNPFTIQFSVRGNN
jgi:hypothetical protein